MTAPAVATRAESRAPYQVTPCDAALGAEITGIDLRQLDDATFSALHALWHQHVLLAFRDQSMAPDDLVRLIKRFGVPVSSSNLHKRNLEERTANQLFQLPPEVTVVTNLKENGKAVGILGDGEVVWHSDFSFKEEPTAARVLLAIEVPPLSAGGTTSFLNAYAAYEALPGDFKRQLAGKTIKQANIVDTAMQLRPGASLNDDFRYTPGPSHPVISTHPVTGNNCIFLGRRHGSYVNGCSLEESEALLNKLWDLCVQPRFIYEHKWRKGDVVVWDNRCTLHRREPFDPSTRRVMYAAQVEGHRPYEAPDALSLPPHPRFALFDGAAAPR